MKAEPVSLSSRLKTVRGARSLPARLVRDLLGGVTGPLARESRLVRTGIARYEAMAGQHAAHYQLRRHVHMIEKGLTMQPRRPVFALDYIVSTVRSYVSLRRDGEGVLGKDEVLWMHSVLADYFDATRAAGDPVLAGLEPEFQEASADLVGERSSGPHRPDTTTPSVASDDLVALARRRRSVRWFEPRPVPREVVDIAVSVAMEAPTACNRQPYRFVVFDDPESVRRVASVPMGTRGYAHQLTGIIVVVGDMSAFFDARDRHLIYVDASLAATGLLLGFESQGVGTCVINWPDMPEKELEMRDLLGLAPHEKTIMLVAFGYPDPEGLVPFSAKADLDAVRVYEAL